MKITAAQLVSAGACPLQVSKFKQFFGDEVDVTAELGKQHAKQFNWHWAGEKLLNKKNSTAFFEEVKAAEVVHSGGLSPFRELRNNAHAAAVKEFKATFGDNELYSPAFHAQLDKISDDYDAAVAPVHLAYWETIAATFCNLYNYQTEAVPA